MDRIPRMDLPTLLTAIGMLLWGDSQRQVSRQLGLSRETVSRIDAGRYRLPPPGTRNSRQIAAARSVRSGEHSRCGKCGRLMDLPCRACQALALPPVPPAPPFARPKTARERRQEREFLARLAKLRAATGREPAEYALD